jgi:MFS family permease
MVNHQTKIQLTGKGEGVPQSLRAVIVLIFLQMLPATLLTPAIRPLFANLHSGKEWAMHAFMAVNMGAAGIAVPFLAMFFDRVRRPHRLIALLAAFNALLLIIMTLPMPVVCLLALRCVEGVIHVGGATILLAEAAQDGIERAKAMGLAGAAIIFAIATGNAIGGFSVGLSWRAPFWLASLIFVIVALLSVFSNERNCLRENRQEKLHHFLTRNYRLLWFPLGVAFLERFGVGCIVVTFSLFAHKAHSLTDSSIGLLFSILTFLFAIFTYPVAKLCNVMSGSLVLTSGAVIYAGSIFLLGQAPAEALPIVMMAGGLGAAMLFAPTLYYAATLAGDSNRATVMGLVNASGCLGMIAGPIVAGIITGIFKTPEDPVAGYKIVFLVAALAIFSWLLIGAKWLIDRYQSESGRTFAVSVALSSAQDRD